MKAIWCLLLVPALASGAVLANDTYRIPPGEWRSLHFPLVVAPARVECRFEVRAQPGAARAVLLAREDLERFATHQPYGYLTATGEQGRGTFVFDVRQTGTFAVLLINSSANRAPSPVQLWVTVGPVPAPPAPAPRTLARGRKLTTVIISIAVFLLLLAWSSGRLLQAMRRDPSSSE